MPKIDELNVIYTTLERESEALAAAPNNSIICTLDTTASAGFTYATTQELQQLEDGIIAALATKATTAALDAETQTRQQTDTTLFENLTTETEERISADAAITARLDSVSRWCLKDTPTALSLTSTAQRMVIAGATEKYPLTVPYFILDTAATNQIKCLQAGRVRLYREINLNADADANAVITFEILRNGVIVPTETKIFKGARRNISFEVELTVAINDAIAITARTSNNTTLTYANVKTILDYV